MVGFAWNALREAFCGEHSDKLLALTYETLTTRPDMAIEAVYDFIGEKRFAHDFDNVEFDADEFDRRLGLPACTASAATYRRRRANPCCRRT